MALDKLLVISLVLFSLAEVFVLVSLALAEDQHERERDRQHRGDHPRRHRARGFDPGRAVGCALRSVALLASAHRSGCGRRGAPHCHLWM